MKPVAIFRHSPTEGPGYFATCPERHRIAWKQALGGTVGANPQKEIGWGRGDVADNEQALADAQGGGLRPSS
jgi:GMP synthase-like glutamine amidotransferase